MTYLRSNYPTTIDKLKTLPIYQDMTIEDKRMVGRYQVLVEKNNLTSDEQLELSSLVERLRDKMINSEDWNQLIGAVLNLETYFKDNVLDEIDNKLSGLDTIAANTVNTVEKAKNDAIANMDSVKTETINSLNRIGAETTSEIENTKDGAISEISIIKNEATQSITTSLNQANDVFTEMKRIEGNFKTDLPILNDCVERIEQADEQIKRLQDASNSVQDDIAKIESVGNKEILIRTSEWTLNGDVYEKEITHNLCSENLHVTAKNSDTKEAVTIGYKILDKTRILLKSDEAIPLSIILSASYYHATQTISDNIAEEVIKARKGEVDLKTKIDSIDEQLDTITNVVSLNIEDFGAIPNNKNVNNELAFNKCIEYIKKNNYKKAIIKASAEKYYFGDGIVDFSINSLSNTLTDNGIIILEGNGFTRFIKKGNNTLFKISHGSFYAMNFVCESTAYQTVSDDENKSICFDLGINNSDSIDGVINGSYFLNIKTFRFNIHFKFSRAFDSQFNNCGAYAIYGKNGCGIYFEGHTYDNTNNINFYRFHAEGTYHNTQSLLKIDGNNLIPNINFHGSHFENNGNVNSNVINIKKGLNINFIGCQITNNGRDNVDVKTIMISSSVVNFEDCIFQKSAFNNNKLFNLTDNSTVIINGGYCYVNGMENSLKSLYEKDSTSLLRTNHFLFKNIENDLNTNMLEINSSYRNNRRYLMEVDDNDSCIMYFNERTRTEDKSMIMEYTRKGKFKPYKGLTGDTIIINNTNSYEFSVFDSADNNRGTVLIQTSIPGGCGAIIIYSDGNQLYTMTQGNENFNINSEIDEKINIILKNGKIKIVNKLGSNRKFTVIPFNFY